MTRAQPIGLCYLFAIMLVLLGHWAAGDSLFFESDLWSMGVYVIAMALVLTPGLCLVAIPSRLLPDGLRVRLHEFVAVSMASVICVVFAQSVLTLIGSWLHISEVLDSLPGISNVDSVRTSILFAMALGFAALFFFLLWRTRRDVAERTSQAGVAALAASLGVVTIVLASTRFVPPSRSGGAEGGQKHAVLMIIDGLPSQYLRAYNPIAPASELDPIIDGSLLFRQMRTSAPVTSNYHRIFYTGRLAGRGDGNNLIAKLQRAGVAVKWISFHRAGFPESNGINAYTGLRSFFLTHETSWIPRLLGLDYHVAVASERLTRNLRGSMAKRFFMAIHDRLLPLDDPLGEILLPELEALSAGSKRSLTIFHMGYYFFPGVGASQELAQAFEGDEARESEILRIRAADYRYSPEQEPIARSERAKTAAHVLSFAKSFAAFYDSLKANEQLKDTVLMVTADHGSVFSQGRFWYGYHPVEEVVRVPLFVANLGRQGTDGRRFTTIDLSESLLDFFDVEEGLNDDALSIFEDGYHAQTASLTQRAEFIKEWFLLIYEGDQKIQVNLHPKSEGITRMSRLDGYGEATINNVVGPPAAHRKSIEYWLEQFGVERDAVHPLYR